MSLPRGDDEAHVMRTPRISYVRLGLVLATITALALPTALSALSGSGNITDIVQLNPTTTSLGTLTATPTGGSASANPITSGATAFTMDNSGSNVDTFIRYSWSTVPYYGANTASQSIIIRGATHYVSDLLWFKQATVNSASVATTAVYFSPLILNSATSVQTSTWTSAGNACTAWTGTAAGGFSATSAGTFTFKNHGATPVNDAPDTSDTFHYCLDTTNDQVYLAKSASFTGATLVSVYSTNSVSQTLKTYRYEMLSGSQTAGQGNKYCLVGETGTGTAASPQLAQCSMLPFETAGVTTAKLYALYDPPAYFPSVNQGGAITYAVAGTQWNPYETSTTNSA